jgi:hypothetical protein
MLDLIIAEEKIAPDRSASGAGSGSGADAAPISRSPRRELLGAALLLVLALALAYGPAKLAGHSLYGGVIQDVTNLYGFYCWDEFSRAELLAGRVPLWNPRNAFGVPHLANMQTALFYPLNWLKWAFGFWPVIDGLLLFRLWLAGFFAWLFARRALKVSFAAALTAGFAFMLSGYFTRFLYMSHLNVETLLPLQLWLMHRLRERPGAGRLLGAGVGFALLILGGFPEATLYAVALALAYYLYAAGLSGRSLATAAAAALIGLLFALPQWLPFVEYYPHAWTYHQAGSGLRHFDPSLAIALILPWFFGENRMSPVAGFLPGYLGIVPVALALVALPEIRRERNAIFFLAAALVLLGLAFGLPPFSLLGRVFPFSLTYNDKYSGPAIALCFALLAALGTERLVRGEGRAGFYLVVGLLLAGIGLNVVAGFRNAFQPVWALGLLDPATTLATVVLLVAGPMLVLLHRRGTMTGRALGGGLAALVLLGLLYDLLGQGPVYHDLLPESATKLAAKLPLASGALRVHAEPELDEVFPNRLLPAGIDDLRLYDPLYPRGYVEYMAEINGLAGDTLRRHYNDNMLFTVDLQRRADPLLDLANLAIVILPAPIEERPLARQWLDLAVTRSSRHESWLRAEEIASGGRPELALIDHAPVRIMIAGEEGGPSGEARSELRFDLAVPDNQLGGGERGDGIFFSIARGRTLAFARYLDAKARPEERGWRPYALRWGKGGAALSLLPGPRNDVLRDAGAFGNLRLWEDFHDDRFERMGEAKTAPYLYRRLTAFPRVWMVKGMGRAPAGSSPLAAVHKLAEVNPITFKGIFVSPWRQPVQFYRGGMANLNEVKVESHEPGRIVIAYSRREDGFVVIADQRLPGWRAFSLRGSERAELPVIPANGPFMAVPAGSGRGRLELLYRPWGFRVGLFAALAAGLFGAALAVMPRPDEKR